MCRMNIPMKYSTWCSKIRSRPLRMSHATGASISGHIAFIGCCHSHPLMIPGGRVFVWPLIQRVQRISLNTMTLSIDSQKVYTQQGVPISVTGIAQVKIQVSTRTTRSGNHGILEILETLHATFEVNATNSWSRSLCFQGQNVEMLRAACEQFLGKSDGEIMNIARETLEGHQRAIMGTMTVEEIYKDRKKFSKQVGKAIPIRNMGSSADFSSTLAHDP